MSSRSLNTISTYPVPLGNRLHTDCNSVQVEAKVNKPIKTDENFMSLHKAEHYVASRCYLTST